LSLSTLVSRFDAGLGSLMAWSLEEG
jgi:hypothetical protein